MYSNAKSRLAALADRAIVTAMVASVLLWLLVQAARADDVPSGTPRATVDLATRDGVTLVKGTWRHHEARIVETEFRAVGADRKPTGPPNRTGDVSPRAGAVDFDDRGWEVIDPTTLDARRSTGKVCFNWYRIAITLPERIGDADLRGTTAVLDLVVDDYAEVWVDGVLSRSIGQRGGSVVAGWNAPNRLVIARDVVPGQKVQLAVFGINGPISDAPPNYIWVRSARVEFHAPLADPVRLAGGGGSFVRKAAGFDALVPASARIERLADGFAFTEGPVWVPGQGLLFSDPNTNVIYRWTPAGRVSVERRESGYSGPDLSRYHQPGSNGLTLDASGRLTVAEHGNRRVTRLEKDGSVTVLADRYQGKRLNSPNDLVYRSDGALYFTDPPFGLPKTYVDPARELDFTGVFMLRNSVLTLVSHDLTGPNGLAFSPDEKLLYVSNWDTQRKIVMRYEVRSDGTLWNGRVFFDMAGAPGEEALDGVKVDARGNVYASGPGGVWVIAPNGTHLGTIVGPELPANMAWGDADGKTLYLTARHGLYRVRLDVAGAPPAGVTAAR